MVKKLVKQTIRNAKPILKYSVIKFKPAKHKWDKNNSVFCRRRFRINRNNIPMDFSLTFELIQFKEYSNCKIKFKNIQELRNLKNSIEETIDTYNRHLKFK